MLGNSLQAREITQAIAEPDTRLPGTFALVCPETGPGIRFSPAPWPALPEQVLVASRKRRGAC